MNKILPWFQATFDFISNCAKQNRLPHAILLYGPQGLGKRDFAIQLAQTFLGKADQVQSCFEQGVHPQFHLIEKKPDQKVISIDQVRAGIQQLYLKPEKQTYQILCLIDADQMNQYAQQALLKTLEEPIANTLIILTTTYRNQLLPTLLSRMQAIHTPAPDFQTAQAWLTEHVQKAYSPEKLSLCLRLSRNAPFQALALCQENLALRDAVIQQLSLFLKKSCSLISCSKALEAFDLHKTLYWIETVISDFIKLKKLQTSDYLIHQDYANAFLKLMDCVSSSYLWSVYFKLKKALQWLSRSPYLNKRLLLEQILLEEA